MSPRRHAAQPLTSPAGTSCPSLLDPCPGTQLQPPSRGHLLPQNNALRFTVLALPPVAAVSGAGHSRQPSGVREANILCTAKFQIFFKLR